MESGDNHASKGKAEVKYKVRRSIQNNPPPQAIQNPTRLKVSEIKFSQSSVKETFQNGNKIEDLVNDLITGKISADNIDPIRVVKFNGEWTTLDNRRLRAFKNAFIKEIPITVCNLHDATIAREFFAKRNNKTIAGGGEIRATQFSSTPNNRNHFDGGIFEFIKIVLGWSFEFIRQSQEPIPQKLPTIFLDRQSYFDSFIPLIKEEARATLQSGLEIIRTQPIFPANVIKYKSPKNIKNPSSLALRLETGKKDFEFNSSDIVILQSKNYPVDLLGWVTQGEESGPGKLQVKVIPEESQLRHYNTAFDEDQGWSVTYIGSLVTQLRMYDACKSKPNVPFWPQLIGQQDVVFLEDETSSDEESANHSSLLSILRLRNLAISKPKSVKKTLSHENELENLNSSQKAAVLKFLKLTKGIQLVQGPPGTGKTTMTVTLMKVLVKGEKSLLVCAPSNKAVQVIAERFIAENPHVPAILVGVEDKLPEDSPLRDIFIHTWSQERKNELMQLQNQLSNLLPDEKNPLENIEQYNSLIGLLQIDFIKFLGKVIKFKLSFFENLGSVIESFTSCVSHYKSLLNTDENDIQDSKEFFKDIRKSLFQINVIFTSLQSTLEKHELDSSKQGLEGQLLNNAIVVFATQSVSGRQSVQQMDKVDVVIIDEAGQSTEAENIIPLTSNPDKMILIGDTKQLPATVLSQHADQHGFSVSMMQRLEKLKCESSLLNIQYRMHPEISQFPSKKYYGSELRDSEKVHSERRFFEPLKKASKLLTPYSFLHVESKEISHNKTSFKNPAEAEVIRGVLRYLAHHLKIDITQDVSIITFYKGQSELLNQMFSGIYPGLKISTVDSFQGDENKIVILSFVRSNPQGNLGFLKDFRRLNVALTRAQYALIMVGNAQTLEKQNNSDLADLIKDAEQRGRALPASLVLEELTKEMQPKIQVPQPQKALRPATIATLPAPAAIQPSTQAQTTPKPWNYKTVPCGFFAQGHCQRGNNCNFAHGQDELRIPRNIHHNP